MTKHPLVWVAMFLAAACGSVSNPNTQIDSGTPPDMMVAAGDFALAVDPGSATLAISGSAEVTVDLTRGDGFSDAVALTATGLPTGATATFATASLPDGTSSTTMTIDVDKLADAGTSTITITGTAGSLVRTVDLSLELQTSTVTGKVRGNSANAVVRIVGKAATTSDSTGNFTFTDVKIPYDIYVIGQTGTTASPTPAVNYYRGLTRLDPVITRPFAVCSGIGCLLLAGQSATINGARSGAGNTTDQMYVAWSTGGSVVTTNAYSFSGSWFGFNQSTVNGTLHALQVARATNLAPTGFVFGTTAATLTAGGTHTVNVPLAGLGTTAAITGTITPPSGFPTPVVSLTQQVGGTSFEIWSRTTADAASLLPVLTNQKGAFHARSTSSSRTSSVVFPGLNAATNVTFTLPPPASMTGPVPGATNVTNATMFEYTTSANQVYEVRFSNATATYVVFTTDGSITIPVVSEMALPANASYTWTVSGYGPHPDVNAAADMDMLETDVKADYDGPIHTYTTNPTRGFMTAQ